MLVAPFLTRAREAATIPHVTSRWFIPLSLLIFAVLVGGLWTYLSATEEPTPAKWVRHSRDTLLDSPPAKPAPPKVEPVAVAKPAKKAGKKSARRFVEPPTVKWTDVAAHVDMEAVKLRLDATESAPAELIAAKRDMDAGRAVAALRAYDNVLARSKGNTAAMAGRAAALTALDRLDEAATCYESLVTLAPRDALARYNYGVLLYRRGAFGEASTQFRELVALQPDHARGHYNLATLAQRAGRLGEARDAWTAFTRLEPAVPSGWFNLGVVLLDFDEPLDAARCFAVFSALRPTEADGFTNLGAAFAAAGSLEDALEALTISDGLMPCDAMVMTALADLHAAMIESDGERAEQHRAQALAISEQVAGME